MALRIRGDGRVLCAAMHPAEPDDRAYLDDGLHYRLSVGLKALVTEPMDGPDGRGGHGAHGEWWWRDEVPDDVVLEPRRLRTVEAVADLTLNGLCAYDAVAAPLDYGSTAERVADFQRAFSLLSAERLASVARRANP